MQQSKTSVLAFLFALATSVAMAQGTTGAVGAINLDTGTSGGSSGLISGGGTISSSLDAKPSGISPSRGSSARADASAKAEVDGDTRAKAKKPRAAAKGFSRPFGFSSFRGYARTRER
jgi:hypothetical protein